MCGKSSPRARRARRSSSCTLAAPHRSLCTPRRYSRQRAETVPLTFRFGCALRCYYAEKDKRVKKEHVEMWQRYGTGSFSVEQVPGNHLFFYDVPARATYMQKVVEGLPSPAFG